MKGENEHILFIWKKNRRKLENIGDTQRGIREYDNLVSYHVCKTVGEERWSWFLDVKSFPPLEAPVEISIRGQDGRQAGRFFVQ